MSPFTEWERARRHRIRRWIYIGWFGLSAVAWIVACIVRDRRMWLPLVAAGMSLGTGLLRGGLKLLLPPPPPRCGTRISVVRSAFRPTCDCGWTGLDYTDRPRAVASARAHAPDVVLIEDDWQPRISME